MPNPKPVLSDNAWTRKQQQEVADTLEFLSTARRALSQRVCQAVIAGEALKPSDVLAARVLRSLSLDASHIHRDMIRSKVGLYRP